MSAGFLFWLLMILWLVFGIWIAWPAAAQPNGWRPVGGTFLLWILLFLLGWKEFGWPIH
jgi:hypothetical protein